MFEPVITALHVMGNPFMRILFPERKLVKKVTISILSEPKLSVGNHETSSYKIEIGNDLSMFNLMVANVYTRIVANGTLISNAQPQLTPSTDEIGYLETQSFEIPAAQITPQAIQLVATLRLASPVSAIDRLAVSLSIEAVVRTHFSKKFSVSHSQLLRMEVIN